MIDLRNKLRRIQEELDEKNEIILELTQLLEASKESSDKLRQENLSLVQEARSAKYLRDEIDILNERVIKVDRLETEIQRYREKLNDLDFMKTRLQEIREDNRLLSESKDITEEQLETARKKNERIPDLEAQILSLRAINDQLQSQVDSDKDKLSGLVDEINQLRVEKKAAIQELSQVQLELTHLRNQSNSNRNQLGSSLMQEINTDASKKLLKLELENQKLVAILESAKGIQTFTPNHTSTPCKSRSSSTSSKDEGPSLEDTLRTTVDKMKDLDVEANQLRNENVKLLQSNKSLQESNKTLEESNKSLEEEVMQLKRSLRESRTKDIQQLISEVNINYTPKKVVAVTNPTPKVNPVTPHHHYSAHSTVQHFHVQKVVTEMEIIKHQQQPHIQHQHQLSLTERKQPPQPQLHHNLSLDESSMRKIGFTPSTPTSTTSSTVVQVSNGHVNGLNGQINGHTQQHQYFFRSPSSTLNASLRTSSSTPRSPATTFHASFRVKPPRRHLPLMETTTRAPSPTPSTVGTDWYEYGCV